MTYLALQPIQQRSDWTWVEFRRVASIRREPNHSSDRPLLALSAATGIQQRPDDGGRQPASDETISKYWVVRPNWLVFNPMWAIERGVAVSQLEGAVSAAYRVYELHSPLHSRFAHYYFRSDSALEQYRLLIRGTTTFDRSITRSDFEAMPVPVPPISEQQAIANYLDAETARIDALISKKRRLIELQQERWEARVRNLLSSLRCTVLPLKRYWRVTDCKHRTPTYIDDGYPVVSPGDTLPGRLDLSRAHRFVDEADYRDLASDTRQPRRGDIIYSRNASIGIASYVDTDAPFCMGQDVCLITSDNMDQLFLMYVLNSVGLDQLEVQKIGSTFSRVNISQILEIQVPVPDLSEQETLSRTLDLAASRRSRACGILEEQIKLLQERRQALITAIVTGERWMPTG